MPTTIRATKPAILIASLLLTTGFAVAGPAAAMIDDIGFEISWPLTYDLQDGTGTLPNKEQ